MGGCPCSSTDRLLQENRHQRANTEVDATCSAFGVSRGATEDTRWLPAALLARKPLPWEGTRCLSPCSLLPLRHLEALKRLLSHRRP